MGYCTVTTEYTTEYSRNKERDPEKTERITSALPCWFFFLFLLC